MGLGVGEPRTKADGEQVCVWGVSSMRPRNPQGAEEGHWSKGAQPPTYSGTGAAVGGASEVGDVLES